MDILNYSKARGAIRSCTHKTAHCVFTDIECDMSSSVLYGNVEEIVSIYSTFILERQLCLSQILKANIIIFLLQDAQ